MVLTPASVHPSPQPLTLMLKKTMPNIFAQCCLILYLLSAPNAQLHQQLEFFWQVIPSVVVAERMGREVVFI